MIPAAPSSLTAVLALYRALIGILWITQALTKAPWLDFGWLPGFIEKELAHPTFETYRAFLEQVVVPHFTVFATMTFVVELALGLALFLGLLTPLVAVLAALWAVNIALGAFRVPGEWGWSWPLLIVPHILFILARSGRVLGLDALLIKQWARQAGPTSAVRRLVLACV